MSDAFSLLVEKRRQEEASGTVVPEGNDLYSRIVAARAGKDEKKRLAITEELMQKAEPIPARTRLLARNVKVTDKGVKGFLESEYPGARVVQIDEPGAGAANFAVFPEKGPPLVLEDSPKRSRLKELALDVADVGGDTLEGAASGVGASILGSAGRAGGAALGAKTGPGALLATGAGGMAGGFIGGMGGRMLRQGASEALPGEDYTSGQERAADAGMAGVTGGVAVPAGALVSRGVGALGAVAKGIYGKPSQWVKEYLSEKFGKQVLQRAEGPITTRAAMEAARQELGDAAGDLTPAMLSESPMLAAAEGIAMKRSPALRQRYQEVIAKKGREIFQRIRSDFGSDEAKTVAADKSILAYEGQVAAMEQALGRGLAPVYEAAANEARIPVGPILINIEKLAQQSRMSVPGMQPLAKEGVGKIEGFVQDLLAKGGPGKTAEKTITVNDLNELLKAYRAKSTFVVESDAASKEGIDLIYKGLRQSLDDFASGAGGVEGKQSAAALKAVRQTWAEGEKAIDEFRFKQLDTIVSKALPKEFAPGDLVSKPQELVKALTNPETPPAVTKGLIAKIAAIDPSLAKNLQGAAVDRILKPALEGQAQEVASAVNVPYNPRAIASVWEANRKALHAVIGKTEDILAYEQLVKTIKKQGFAFPNLVQGAETSEKAGAQVAKAALLTATGTGSAGAIAMANAKAMWAERLIGFFTSRAYAAMFHNPELAKDFVKVYDPQMRTTAQIVTGAGQRLLNFAERLKQEEETPQ